MTTNLSSLALEGGDPRDPVHAKGRHSVSDENQLLRNSHDSSVSFEEYVYYAKITREEERVANARHVEAAGPRTFMSTIKNRFSKGHSHGTTAGQDHVVEYGSEKDGTGSPTGTQRTLGNVSDSEWKTASRAVRTASWSSCFFLITTDILGPFSVPWAFAQMGYGPGVALYTVFGGFAMCKFIKYKLVAITNARTTDSGFQIWKIYLALDSDKYPMKNFGDSFFRVYGSVARHAVNILQAVQLLFTVSILILSNGQSISQISKGSICFVVCLIIFMAAGMLVGQIRTLQRFGWLANFAVWINVLIIFITWVHIIHPCLYMLTFDC